MKKRRSYSFATFGTVEDAVVDDPNSFIVEEFYVTVTKYIHYNRNTWLIYLYLAGKWLAVIAAARQRGPCCAFNNF
jgi:hypothetical protein